MTDIVKAKLLVGQIKAHESCGLESRYRVFWISFITSTTSFCSEKSWLRRVTQKCAIGVNSTGQGRRETCWVCLLETFSCPTWVDSVPMVHSDAFEVKLFILLAVSWNGQRDFAHSSDAIRWQHLLCFRIWPVNETDVELVHISLGVLN